MHETQGTLTLTTTTQSFSLEKQEQSLNLGINQSKAILKNLSLPPLLHQRTTPTFDIWA